MSKKHLLAATAILVTAMTAVAATAHADTTTTTTTHRTETERTVYPATTGYSTYNESHSHYSYDNAGPSIFPALTGFYAGGYGGYSWNDTDTDFGVSVDPKGWDYGAFVGYSLDAWLDRSIGLGMTGAVEGHYGWSGGDTEDSSGAIGLKKKHEWGVDFRPGFSFVNDATASLGIKPYGIIGYRRAEYETSFGGVGNDHGFNGFELGAGTEFITFQHFGIRADYTHVWYGENNGFDPSEDNVRIGLAYHF